MGQGCADLTFGLQPQALAIAYLLSGKIPDFADWDAEAKRFDIEIETYPWYNGREKAVCLLVYLRSSPDTCLYLVFGEDRRTDNLFVERWEGGKPEQQPSMATIDEDAHEEASRDRRTFEASKVSGVANYVFELMAEFYENLRRETE
jgi:hypothetical protein